MFILFIYLFITVLCTLIPSSSVAFFCFNDTATTEIYTYLHTLSLHDALPISFDIIDNLAVVEGRNADTDLQEARSVGEVGRETLGERIISDLIFARSEEHTSELQSLMRISYAVFCLKKKQKQIKMTYTTVRYKRQQRKTI